MTDSSVVKKQQQAFNLMFEEGGKENCRKVCTM
jgi:hypothetical protein